MRERREYITDSWNAVVESLESSICTKPEALTILWAVSSIHKAGVVDPYIIFLVEEIALTVHLVVFLHFQQVGFGAADITLRCFL